MIYHRYINIKKGTEQTHLYFSWYIPHIWITFPYAFDISSNTACLYGGEIFLSPLASKICLHRTGTLTWKGIGYGLHCVEYV